MCSTQYSARYGNSAVAPGTSLWTSASIIATYHLNGSILSCGNRQGQVRRVWRTSSRLMDTVPIGYDVSALSPCIASGGADVDPRRQRRGLAGGLRPTVPG